jgi:hypothetical protein
VKRSKAYDIAFILCFLYLWKNLRNRNERYSKQKKKTKNSRLGDGGRRNRKKTQTDNRVSGENGKKKWTVDGQRN